MRSSPLTAPLLTPALLLMATPAAAALDPETGSYVFQVLATAALAAVFALRKAWPRRRERLGRRRPDSRQSR